MSAFFNSKIAFLDYKKFVECAYQTTKVCSVRFFRLQKFVECAFLDYKSLQCPLFEATKVCRADVSEQFTLAKQVFIILSLCPPDNYITLTNEKTGHGLGREHLDV